MKKLSIFSCAMLLFINIIYSQHNYEYTFYNFETYISEIAINNGNLATVSQSSVIYFDTAGNKKWERYFTSLESNSADFQRVFFDQEQNIVAAGPSSLGCDIIEPERDLFIIKLDTLGDTLFFTKFTFNSYDIGNIAIIELMNSNYLIALDSNLIWLSAEGDSLKTKQFGYTRVKDLNLLNDSTLFLMTNQELALLDLEGNTLSQIDNTSDAIGNALINDSLYVLDKNNIELYTNQLLNKIIIPLPNLIEAYGITQDNQSIIIWGKEINSGRSKIFQYKNNEWQILYTAPKSIEILTNVKAINNHYYLAGRNTWGGDAWNSLHFVKSTSNLADTISHHDLSFLAARTTLIEYDTVLGGGGTITYHFEFDIQNNGTDTIHNFLISTGVFFSAFCSNFRFQVGSGNIILPPGEKITITSAQLLPYIIARVNGNPTSYCFFLAAPNHGFENNQENNKSCSTTSAKKIQLPSHFIRLFPNPSVDQVQIQTDNELSIESLHLYNIAGQLQNITSDINFNQATLHRNNLPAGLYWLKIQTKDGFVMKKVVFQ